MREKSHRSYKTLLGVAIFQFSLLFVFSLLSGRTTEATEIFGPIFEYMVGIGYVLSLVLAAIDDIKNDKIEHITTVLIVSIVLKFTLTALVEVGIMAAIAGVMIVFFVAACGPANVAVFSFVAWLLGALGPVVAVAIAVAMAFSSAMLWG